MKDLARRCTALWRVQEVASRNLLAWTLASACSPLLENPALECCHQDLNAASLCLFAGAYAYSVASANSTARPNVGQSATAAAAAQAVSRVTACPADLISTYAQVRGASDRREANSMLAVVHLIWS